MKGLRLGVGMMVRERERPGGKENVRPVRRERVWDSDAWE